MFSASIARHCFRATPRHTSISLSQRSSHYLRSNQNNTNGLVRYRQRQWCSTKSKDSTTSNNVAREEATNATTSTSTTANQTWLQRFLGPKPMPPRGTLKWYGEMALICTVFGITGSSTMLLVRPAVKNGLGLEGSFKDGPWAYRISTIVIMSPLYSILLVVVGTVFGRHAYFRFFSVKMLSRFGIPPELLDKEFHVTKKNFRKW